MLEPDHEYMERFQPVISKFKDAFFDGADSESGDYNAPRKGAAARGGAGRGRGRGGSGLNSQRSSQNGAASTVKHPKASTRKAA